MIRPKRILATAAAAAALIVSLLGNPAETAAQQRSFISDAEIENTIREMATPLFVAAGLDPEAIRIILLRDDSINAFVAAGKNLFIHTGLLTKAQNPGQLIGVLAHEIGHISGGHIARSADAVRDATTQTIITMVLGAAAAVASGRVDVGAAIISGGQQLGLRGLLQYSRTQESSADQAAMKFLEATGQSATGFLEILETLGDQEILSPNRQASYARTHPLAIERIRTVRLHVEKSKFANTPTQTNIVEQYLRMKAKLEAFFNPPTRTLAEYKESDTSIPARYARAIALFRIPQLDQALTMIDSLIADRPQDAYFYELKGQMLFENGRVADAIAPYEESVRLHPEAYLLRVGLARAQIESQDPQQLDAAIQNLRAAVVVNRESPFVWRQLAIAYGRDGQTGLSSLAMAEEALLRRQKREAVFYGGRAERELPRGSPAWTQAQDVLRSAEELKD